MKEGTISPQLIYEEKKAIKLFLWLFNVIFFVWDVFYYYLMPYILRGKRIFTGMG
ncbi:hypothetical protein [Neobacillus sp. OS1-2]|uniref:hypothetical protein n=1 Tax=Neobacillus sp. OS1-2 TaxID=3070680 RepID=UPI0035A64874